MLKFDLKSSGSLSTLPYVAIFIVFMGSGRLADMALQRGYPVTRVRRTFQTLAFVLSTASFLGLAYARDKTIAVACLTAAVGFLGIASGKGVLLLYSHSVSHSALAGGFNMNHIDIGGEFSGILMGMTNT